METEDNEFYSRQVYVLGDEAMSKIKNSKVFLQGAGPLGFEIAKNLVLAGVGAMTIQDVNYVKIEDIGSHFCLTKNDTGRKRADAVCEKLSQLNPCVKLIALYGDLNEDSNLQCLSTFDCIILTDVNLPVQLHVNQFCRAKAPQPIRFISATVCGFFCWTFNDFGHNFDVVDADGEMEKEIYISFISKSNPGVVTTLDDKPHGLETGDVIQFSNIEGMAALNGRILEVKPLSPSTFEICDTSNKQFEDYLCGGIATHLKFPCEIQFESLQDQLINPKITPYYSNNVDSRFAQFLAMLSYYHFRNVNKRSPKLGDDADANAMLQFAHQINSEYFNKTLPVDQTLIEKLSKSSRGCLIPLNSFLGGIVAQEALKAITSKFTPIQQWLFFNCCELMESLTQSLLSPYNRYFHISGCLKESVIKKLANLKVLLVGCGAIGCEILKNCALLGVGTKEGNITIVDHDIVERSNLNTQTLYREQNIQVHKSIVAVNAVKAINADTKIIARTQRICPETSNTFSTEFFESFDVILAALDNLEGRRYLDSLSVKYSRPIFDSGLNGNKAHVQVVIPHLTETYTSQPDPPEQDVPYCIIKSFPSRIEHVVQWAKEKFDSYFYTKPNAFNKFWRSNTNIPSTIASLKSGEQVDYCVTVAKYLRRKPQNIKDCVIRARFMFEKYFNFKAKQLLASFPIDSKLDSGAKFWHFPKTPPTPITFDPWDKLHFNFIKSTAILIAFIYNIKERLPENLPNILLSLQVPEFVPKNKVIETDETVAKPAEACSDDEATKCAIQIENNISSGIEIPNDVLLVPATNRREEISRDFIFCASNLRAAMYGIKPASKSVIRKISEKVIPSMITTASVVSSLMTLELLKFASDFCGELHQNYFFNLATSHFVAAQPCEIQRVKLKNGITFSLWDKWEIKGNPNFTLKNFVDQLVTKTGMQISMIVDGKLIVFLPIMPGHKKRFTRTMLSLLKVEDQSEFRDLSVAFENPDINDESVDSRDVMGPPIRYYLK